ncbi:BF3164 family lipoprotein [Portibacter lacus]|nr:BF3164 family lipoprotein [Portibacter lacus]
MKFSYLNIYFLALLFIGCNEKQESVTETFIEKNITAEVIHINEFIYRPSDMIISDNYLVIHDKYDESLFKIFDLDDLKNSKSWGELGDGPDKIKYVSYNSLSRINNGFGFVDKYTFRQFQIKNNLDVIEAPSINLSKNLGIINGFCRLNDNLFIANSISEGDLYEHVFLKGNEIIESEFGSYPEEDIPQREIIDKQRYYSKFGLSNEKKSRLFTFYYKQNIVKMYDFDGKLIGETNLEFDEIIKKDQKALAFMSGTSNEDYIFLINPNKIQKDVKNDPENYHPNLIVMNWEGKLIAKLKIQEPIGLISVDSNNKVYGMTSDLGDRIFKYDLSSIL